MKYEDNSVWNNEHLAVKKYLIPIINVDKETDFLYKNVVITIDKSWENNFVA